MKILLIASFCFVIAASGLTQSRTENFEIFRPEEKVAGSLYNGVGFIDSRHDKTNFGIVQVGAFNRKATVTTEVPFAIQINNLVKALTDADAGNQKLLFQLRQFSFAEITGAMSEKGYCYLRAALFAGANGRYQKLGFIDTVILVKAMDVTNKLFKRGSQTLSAFVQQHLKATPSDTTVYSFNDIAHIDLIEKRGLAIYQTDSLVEGVYSTFESFAKQVPDKPVLALMKKDKIKTFQTPGDDGKPVTLKPKEIYGVVYNGKAYVITDFGYYPLRKEGDDFYFTGKAKVTANAGDVIAASFFFGVIGGLIAADAEALFEMKLDHLNGGFIRLRQAPVAPSN